LEALSAYSYIESKDLANQEQHKV